MSKDPLADARHKIERGRKRLSDLKEVERALNHPTHERMVIDYDPEQGCHISSFVFDELPPVDLALTLGECIHALRGALEYVTWQLAWKAKSREPSEQEARKIQFPICDESSWFAKSAVLKQVEKDAAKELALHQPYAEKLGPIHDPASLSLLRDLSNQDKHRLIVISAHAMNPATADVRWRNPRATGVRSESVEHDESPIEPPFPVKIPIDRILTDPPEVAMHTEFDVKQQPAARISFDGPGQNFHLAKLDALADCVEFIVGRFDVYV
jgi:hypothetical protein